MSRIKLDIPNLHATEIEVHGRKVTIPRITLYHRRYIDNFEEGDKLYELVVPLIKKIVKIGEDDTIRTDEYEYITIKLFEHNNILNKITKMDGEVFRLEDLKFDYITSFEYEGNEYIFRRPNVGEYFDGVLDGLNNLQIETDIDFNQLKPIVFKYAYKVLGTVSITGSLGNKIRGLDAILDFFVDDYALKVLGERNVGI